MWSEGVENQSVSFLCRNDASPASRYGHHLEWRRKLYAPFLGRAFPAVPGAARQDN